MTFLPKDISKTFQLVTDNILNKSSRLANAADRDGRLLFAMVPKFHWLWHLAQRSRFLNPRRGSTSIDETFVGIMKEIVKSSAHGTRAEAVPESVMEKYVLGMHFALKFC